MCRCEGVLYMQKLRELEGGGVDLHIPKEVSESWRRLIGIERLMGSYPEGSVLYND